MTPTRKRRLAKVARATEQVMGALWFLRERATRQHNDELLALCGREATALYYLSRLARKAP